MKVYLAGGMHSNWRDMVLAGVGHGVVFLDPCSENMPCPKYVKCDIEMIAECDVLFGFMEASNPSGLGLATEIGYAHGLGKFIMLTDEKSTTDRDFRRHFAFARYLPGVWMFENLPFAISELDWLASDWESRT